MAKKPQKPTTETKLPYLEYCTLEQAAGLLNVPLWIIQHYLEIGAVQPVVKLNRLVDSGNVLFPDGDPDLQKINDNLYSKICNAGNDDYLLTGLWKIKNQVIVNDILSSTEREQRSAGLSGVIRFFPIDDKGGNSIEDLCTFTVFDDQITRSDLLLLRKDLLSIEGAIEKYQPIHNMYNNEMLSKEYAGQLGEIQTARSRTMPKQSDLIVALIRSHPLLGEKALDEPYKALDIITAQFAQDGTPYNEGATPESVANWIKSSAQK
ncbi:hypothetical protein [Vibrio alginolyticus]|uniref:hypothetical protein n=1 Tax=Vibrio alginolyticus TaxID=663 RepID=UPI003D284828